MIAFTEYPADGSGPNRYVVDLASDFWQDFLHYTDELTKAAAAGRLAFQAKNRAIRGAIWSLCSHLDGIVSGLHRHVRRTDPEFRYRSGEDGREGSLCEQVNDLKRDAEQRKRFRLGYLKLRMKLLRDVLAHPGIVKEDKHSKQQVMIFAGGEAEVRIENTRLTEANLYLLDPEDMERDAREIDRWLYELCEAYEYHRFPDTKQVLEEYLRRYGGSGTIHRI